MANILVNCHVLYTLMGQMPMLFITQLLVILPKGYNVIEVYNVLHCRMATLPYPSRTTLVSDISTLILILPPTHTLWEA